MMVKDSRALKKGASAQLVRSGSTSWARSRRFDCRLVGYMAHLVYWAKNHGLVLHEVKPRFTAKCCANLLHPRLFRSGWRNNARLSGFATRCANLKTTLPPVITAASLLNTRETSRRSARRSDAAHGWSDRPESSRMPSW